MINDFSHYILSFKANMKVFPHFRQTVNFGRNFHNRDYFMEEVENQNLNKHFRLNFDGISRNFSFTLGRYNITCTGQ